MTPSRRSRTTWALATLDVAMSATNAHAQRAPSGMALETAHGSGMSAVTAARVRFPVGMTFTGAWAPTWANIRHALPVRVA